MSQLLRLMRTSNVYSRNFSSLNSYSVTCKSKSVLLRHAPATNVANSQNSRRDFSYQALWMEISNSTPVAYLQHGLLYLHDTTGLPWWATIIISTIFLRTFVTLPFTIYQNKITSRIELISLEMPDIVKELKRETAIAIKQFGWTEKEARVMYNRSLRKQWNSLVVRDNCHPAKTSILLWTQIPLWICQSVAIRNLVYMLPDPNLLEAQITVAELMVGGFGWIPNLIEVDASYILPVTLGLVNLSIIEIQTMMRLREPTKFQRYATNFFRGFSILMVPIATQVPACLCLYWVTSSCVGLIQNLMLLSPKVKRLVGIPETQSELSEPYQHLGESIQQRFSFLGKSQAKTSEPSTASSETTNTESRTKTKHH